VNRDAAIAASRALTAEQVERKVGAFKPRPPVTSPLTKEDWAAIRSGKKLPPRRTGPSFNPPSAPNTSTTT
jgi:hypothetical protein